MSETITRPDFSERIAKALTEAVGEILTSWSGDGKGYKDQYWLDKIEKVLNRCDDYDGYELAKELEWDLHISPDSLLVDELGILYSDALELEEKFTRQWVTDTGATLQHPIGVEVEMPRHYEERTGIVVALYPDRYKYGVRTPKQAENSHYILKAEDIQGITQTVKV